DHGTHVAGTIAAADNAFGVVGVAPRVKLWSAKVLDRNGDGSSEELVAAFAWTIEKARTAGGRWVVNLSIGGPDYSAIEERAAIDMIAAGIVVIAGAGNGGTEAGEFPTVMFPAGYRGVIAVGATNKNGGRAPFSSYGGGLALMAPGAAIRSTLRHGHFVTVEVKTTDGTTTPAWRIEGASYGSVTGKVYDCGVGDPENFPAAVRDNIALVRRGKHNFRELARNARDAGAAAVIIATYPDDVNGPYEWSFRPDPPDPAWDGYVFPVAVGMQHAAAEAILQSANDYTIDHITHLYGTMNGTSMSAPHVSGTAALLLSLAPELTPSWISAILRYTARDMDAPGWDAKTGAGAVDALKAAQWVAPETFGVPPQTPPKQGRRRSVR
ncbi:MAG TPA: S8 family serine peptidase, partial [Thermoanaerobaculia bacterium]